MAFCLRMKIHGNRRRAKGIIKIHQLAGKQKANEDIDRRVKEGADILGIRDLRVAAQRRSLAGKGGESQSEDRRNLRSSSLTSSQLDAKMRVQMRTEISRLHNKLRTTMIYVTRPDRNHDHG